MPTQTTWTDPRVERLRKLWAAGHSASDIARELGGITRNAVIGKIARLGLVRCPTGPRPIRPKPARPEPSPQPSAVGSAPVRPIVLVLRPAAPELAELPLTLLQLTETSCRWPVTADRPFRFCGHPRADGSPYCAEHRARAHTRVVSPGEVLAGTARRAA